MLFLFPLFLFLSCSYCRTALRRIELSWSPCLVPPLLSLPVLTCGLSIARAPRQVVEGFTSVLLPSEGHLWLSTLQVHTLTHFAKLRRHVKRWSVVSCPLLKHTGSRVCILSSCPRGLVHNSVTGGGFLIQKDKAETPRVRADTGVPPGDEPKNRRKRFSVTRS